jgi:hypothetical protein
MVFVQPSVRDLPQFARVHRLVMIIQTFPPECAGEPPDKRLFLVGVWALSSNAQGGKIALRGSFMFPLPLTALMFFPKQAAAFSGAALERFLCRFVSERKNSFSRFISLPQGGRTGNGRPVPLPQEDGPYLFYRIGGAIFPYHRRGPVPVSASGHSSLRIACYGKDRGCVSIPIKPLQAELRLLR